MCQFLERVDRLVVLAGTRLGLSQPEPRHLPVDPVSRPLNHVLIGGDGCRGISECELVRGFLIPGATLVEYSLAIAGDQLLAGFDQQRQRRLGISGDGEIRFIVFSEVLIVALHEQIHG